MQEFKSTINGRRRLETTVETRVGGVGGVVSTISASLSQILSLTKVSLCRFISSVAPLFSTTSSSVALVGDLSLIGVPSLSIPVADETLWPSLSRFLSSVALLFSATSPLVALFDGDESLSLFICCSVDSVCGWLSSTVTEHYFGGSSGIERKLDQIHIDMFGLCLFKWMNSLQLSKRHRTKEFAAIQDSSNFVELLNSQKNVFFGNVADSVSLSSSQVPFLSSQGTEDPNIGDEPPAERKERRTWTPTYDIVLISSWLNTSKDPVVGNEQRSVTFWKRIAAYFSASPKLAGCEKREAPHCKQLGTS
uniref:Uncharacterized protein n=1 Tax=Brassica oleracea var. oleracea TaxID=109376 RepID=A0A0D3D5W9_BRAOL